MIRCYNTDETPPKDNILLQIELEKLKIEVERLKLQNRNSTPNPVFDVAKNIKLVPKLSRKSVDKYFSQFEKIAENLNWPRRFWLTQIQSVLTDKAAEVYSSFRTQQTIQK